MQKTQKELSSFMKSIQFTTETFGDKIDEMHADEIRLASTFHQLQTNVKKTLITKMPEEQSSQYFSALYRKVERSHINKPIYNQKSIKNTNNKKVFRPKKTFLSSEKYVFKNQMFRSQPCIGLKRIYGAKKTSTFIQEDADKTQKSVVNPYLHVGIFHEDEIDWNQIEDDDEITENDANQTVTNLSSPHQIDQK